MKLNKCVHTRKIHSKKIEKNKRKNSKDRFWKDLYAQTIKTYEKRTNIKRYLKHLIQENNELKIQKYEYLSLLNKKYDWDLL